jgi:hypothetical protein
MSGFTAGPFANGAAIMTRVDVRTTKFDVYRADGALIASKRDLDAAIALARTLPDAKALGLEPVIEPHRLSWSPRASAQMRAAELGVETYTPAPEPADGEEGKGAMSEARRRSGVGPSDRYPTVQPKPREPT